MFRWHLKVADYDLKKKAHGGTLYEYAPDPSPSRTDTLTVTITLNRALNQRLYLCASC